MDQHVNLSKIISYQNVWKSHLVYNHIYIFCLVASWVFIFFCTWSYLIQIIFTQIYLTYRYNPNRYYYFESEWTWEEWQWRGTPHCPNLQNWSLYIRYSFVSYPGHIFFGGWGSVLLTGCSMLFFFLCWLVEKGMVYISCYFYLV